MSGFLRRVAAVRIFTRDLYRSRAFYGDALGLQAEGQGEGFALFSLGDVDIVLEAAQPSDPEGSDHVGRFLAVSFELDDIEAAYAGLAGRGVTFLEPPETQPWGGVLANAHDPDGNIVTLVQYPDGAA